MTTTDRNPQAKEMADESMVRNLAAQADAIWPQEEAIFSRHSLVLPAAAAILDVGCGTGEITARVGAVYTNAKLTGIDIIESHLVLARRRCAALGDRVTFATGDAYDLQIPAATFDLVVCRHMLQAVPEPERILAELVRVLKPGAVLHVIAEDYDMIHAAPTRIDVSRFWFEGPRALGRATGTDLGIGRNIFAHLRRLPVDNIRVDHIVVDTTRVERSTFAAIFEAWRDGYTETTASHLGWSEADVRAHFDATIDCIRDPDGYAVWFVPVWTARVRR